MTDSFDALPLSLLDLAVIGPGETARDALGQSERLAEFADTTGYRRIWYAEHHNMRAIASAAPAVIVAHMAARTRRIRLGAGGVMLPNHSPLTVAEQFGTLAELHPGRIDLGLGRAPGGDPATFAALRRSPQVSERFPDDVAELAALLDGRSIDGVTATPGAGTRVPLYILGSSLFGAQLAAAFGLPYAFASHFAPAALEQAVALYRNEFVPAERADGSRTEPYVIAATSVIADDDPGRAAHELERASLSRIKLLFGRGRNLTDEEARAALSLEPGRQVASMLRYAAVGTPAHVRTELAAFAAHAGADELMLAPLALDRDVWLGTVAHLAPPEPATD